MGSTEGGELRSHMPQGLAKKKKNQPNQRDICSYLAECGVDSVIKDGDDSKMTRGTVIDLQISLQTPVFKKELCEQLVAAKGEGGRQVDSEPGVSRCKLLPREWMGSKVLLHSAGSYVQQTDKP